MTEVEREAKNAAWRQWYADNKQQMQVYYRKRYKRRIQQETPDAREERLAQQRLAQAKYEAKNAGQISDKRKAERKQRCSKCLTERQKGERMAVKKARTGRILGRYCGKCRVKKGL